MLGRWLHTHNNFAGSKRSLGAGDAAQVGSVRAPLPGGGGWAESFRHDHADLVGPNRPGSRFSGNLYWLLATTSILSAIVFGLVVETTRSVGAREARQEQDGHRAALQQAEDRITTLALELRSEKDAAEIARSLLARQVDEGRRALEAVEADLKRTQYDRQLLSARAEDREQALQRLEGQFEASRGEVSTLRSEAADLQARADAAIRAQALADEARRVAEAALAQVGLTRDGDAPARMELASIDADLKGDVAKADAAEGGSGAARAAAAKVGEVAPVDDAPVSDLRPRWLTLGGATFASLDALAPARGIATSKPKATPPPSVLRRASPRTNRGRPLANAAAPASAESSPAAKALSDEGGAGSIRETHEPVRASRRPVSSLSRPALTQGAPQLKSARGDGASSGKKLSNPK
ncbi:Chromosome partition protein Smc [Methylobacterium bullatum]|uniref:Chromosome partition protein Smc n=1 Tax=Methylobacterium bullatum TaxID=570505 RepID=A0A679IQA7_9HYPH|nr:Chromosome partition protein Smc [Methylobacterium bullatum]